MQSPAEYRLLRTSEELTGFVPAWRSLWQRDPIAMPFQSPEWLAPWWRQFGTDKFCGVVIERSGEPAGFLPFYVYREPANRQRQLLPLGVGTTDYLDGVFAPECTADAISGAVRFLRSEVQHDFFCVAQLPERSRLLQTLKREPDVEPIFLSQSDGCSRMPAVKIPDLPQKIRRNAMYYRNRAQRRGDLELVQADESDWQEIFAELQQLHTLRWRTRGEAGVLADERVLRWHREAIPLLLKAGLLRLMALKLDEQIIAVLYSLIDRIRDQRTQYFYITAYSPEYSDLRAGTLLIAYAVQHAAIEGVATIDMLRGDEEYKQIWHMAKSPTWCVTQFAERQLDRRREETAA